MVVDEWIVILVDETHVHLRKSSCVPSIVVLSLLHQIEDLASKSPKIIVNKEFRKESSLKTFSKFLGSEAYIQHEHNHCYFV